jgi:hypothetical protein
MRSFLNAIKGFPHAEERSKGASRSTHGRDASNFLTASCAEKTKEGDAALDHLNASEH